MAANVGTSYLKNFCENNQDLLESNAFEFLVRGITEAHAAIKEEFVKSLTEKGFEVKETEEGYLVKRKSSKSQWVCVHGGTSCSVVALVGTQMYTGNVGDSTGIMSTSKPVLHDSMLQFVGDSADMERKTSSIEAGNDETTNTLVITSDHSPESPVEFCRMRKFRAKENDPTQPALLVSCCRYLVVTKCLELYFMFLTYISGHFVLCCVGCRWCMMLRSKTSLVVRLSLSWMAAVILLSLIEEVTTKMFVENGRVW